MTTITRTAGMVEGTPDWQLDRMYETETAEILEAQYAEDDFPVSSIESEFSRASYYIGQAVDHLIRAAREAERYGKEKPIDELIEKLDDDLSDQMEKVIRKYKEGK